MMKKHKPIVKNSKGVIIATAVVATLVVTGCTQKPPEPGSAVMLAPGKAKTNVNSCNGNQCKGHKCKAHQKKSPT